MTRLLDAPWEDILAFVYKCCEANVGAAGVDNQQFADIEPYGTFTCLPKEWQVNGPTSRANDRPCALLHGGRRVRPCSLGPPWQTYLVTRPVPSAPALVGRGASPDNPHAPDAEDVR